jgi:hypothetical protein
MITFSALPRRLGAALLAGFLAACGGGDGPVQPDPCDAAGACEVQGIDLTLDALTLDAPLVAELALQVAPAGGTVTAAFTVRNRGSENAPASAVKLCVNPSCRAAQTLDVPALAPGGTHQGSAVLSLARISGQVSVAAALSGTDADSANGARSVPLLAERPDLRLQVRIEGPQQQNFLVGTNVQATIITTNVAYVAGAPESTGSMCQLGRRVGECAERAEYPVPALAAGASYERPFTVALSPSLLRYADDPASSGIQGCTDVYSRVDQPRDLRDCDSRYFYVRPDLALTCPPVPIAPGGSVSGMIQESDCDFTFAGNADLLKFEAAANTTYRLTLESYGAGASMRVSDLRVENPDGAFGSIVIPIGFASLRPGQEMVLGTRAAGTYYLALSQNFATGDQPYTVRLTQQ